MEPYTVTKSSITYHGAIVNVSQDTILLPNGNETLRETVIHGGAAAVVPVNQAGHIIFVRQYRHAAKDLVLEIPAGTLEKGENPLNCARRELEEETGFMPGNMRFIMKMYSSIGFCTELLHIYLAENLTAGVQNLDPDEFVTIESYSFNDALEMILQGDIIDSKTIAAVLACKEILSRSNR